MEEPLLDEQRQARQQQHSNGQEQTADTSDPASVEDLKAQHERVSAGHAAASGATRPPGEAALAGGRGGQTAGRQHSQDMNRGGGSNRTDGPGYER
ncbi:hypothetical protein AB0E63_19925 [Kribbella sp. NPDC026596]|uniref:hypothetical protein n=1 Tax=Kribbella sp. NPDC026596 TaxID=3155122 RepID=UPI0033FF0A4E